MQKGKAEVTRHGHGLVGTDGVVNFHDQMASTEELNAHGFKSFFIGMFHRRAVHFVEGASHNSATDIGRFKHQGSRAKMKTSFDVGHVRGRTRVFIHFSSTAFPSRHLILLSFAAMGRLGPQDFSGWLLCIPVPATVVTDASAAAIVIVIVDAVG